MSIHDGIEFEDSTEDLFDDKAICPKCRDKQDMSDWRGAYGRVWNCQSCGEPMLIEAHYEVTYSTYARKNPDEAKGAPMPTDPTAAHPEGIEGAFTYDLRDGNIYDARGVFVTRSLGRPVGNIFAAAPDLYRALKARCAWMRGRYSDAATILGIESKKCDTREEELEYLHGISRAISDLERSALARAEGREE